MSRPRFEGRTSRIKELSITRYKIKNQQSSVRGKLKELAGGEKLMKGWRWRRGSEREGRKFRRLRK
jgi:hypothetical protein